MDGTAGEINVLLVEDDSDFVYLVRKMISQDSRLNFMAYATRGKEGVSLARKLRPDIVLMDVSLSENDGEGIEAARDIRLSTNAKVILLTALEQPEAVIRASKKSFASGYIFKSGCRALTDTVYDTAVSRAPLEQFIKELILQDLTSAEREVFNMMIHGKSEIKSANQTIANQKTKIYRKLGIQNARELAQIFANY